MDDPVETELSFGDESTGRVILRGLDLARLAETHDYEAVMAILWAGIVPALPSAASLGAARVLAAGRLAPLQQNLLGWPAADAMRVLAACLPADADAIRAVAHIGVCAAYATCCESGVAWTAPDPASGHLADILALATGAPAPARAVQGIVRYGTLMIDHGISASTFAVRVVAATGGGLAACFTAGVAAMEGIRHGGAPAMVLAQLDAIAGPADAARYVREALANRRRIIGFGSRAYRGRDARADMMREAWLAAGGASGARRTAEMVEEALRAALARAQPNRPLEVNVEYYAALLLESTGLPRHGFTPVFAAARAAGWAAHVFEQRKSRRLIRPASRYVGKPASD